MQRLIDLVESTRKARLEEPDRLHLGCSEVGHECDRAVWLGFRWASHGAFTGRHYGMFRRGHQEEEWIAEDLDAVDMPVVNKQAQVCFSEHLGGSIDGELVHLGIPTLLEAKCLSPKRIAALRKRGCAEAEPTHYAQAQLYMLGRGLTQALYYSVDKSTDDLYLELIGLYHDFAVRQRNRGLRLVEEPDIPPPIPGGSERWYRCKMCKHHGLCWDNTVHPSVNCRTCMHSTPTVDGWICESGHFALSEATQRTGCDRHSIHPGLVPWTLVGEDNGQPVYEWNGKRFTNGPSGYSSRELTECFEECVG